LNVNTHKTTSAFLRNEQKYPDPENFRPERWLEPSWPTYQEPLSQYPTIMGMTSFGWGQRSCLGQSLTRDETVVACGGLLWAYNLVKKKGPNGKLIDPPLNKSNSLLIVKPDPFDMAFEPRSEKRRQETIELWNESDAQDRAERAAFAKAADEKLKPKLPTVTTTEIATPVLDYTEPAVQMAPVIEVTA
jgi:hypothetical protein